MCKQKRPNENIETTVENEFFQYINEEVTAGSSIFALQDLTDIMTESLEQHGIKMIVNRTRLKQKILEHFPFFTEEKGSRGRV